MGSLHAFRRALVLVLLVFREVYFGGSASLHDWFLCFLAKLYEYFFGTVCIG